MSLLRAALIAILMVVPDLASGAGIRGAIGVLGDSYGDEYQFYPPDRSSARNWVEILSALRGVDFGEFSSSSWGEPRNQGFACNWARSAATTDDMIATGQHTGLAAQVARGEVGLVMISIGGNDFINAIKTPDPMAALEPVIPRLLANYRTAVETILSAHADVRVVLATLSDIRNLPEFAMPIREGQIPTNVADAYTAAIARFNVEIKAIAAANYRIAVLDLDMSTRIANLVNRDQFILGGVAMDRCRPGNGLDSFFLADGRHPGTMGQGLMAMMFVNTINRRFQAGIPPLTDREIVEFARSLPGRGRGGADEQVAGLEDASRKPTTATSMP
jgi:lysophospholipase L1-like esterase